MVYPNSFHKIALNGTIYTEGFSTSLNVARAENMQPVDAALLASLAVIVENWFKSTGSNAPIFIANCKLTELKVNRIDTSGHYQDPESFTHTYPVPVAGTGATNIAPQLTAVATLNTAIDRGLANRGRMYLPPLQGFDVPASDGRVDVTVPQRVSRAVSTLINSINAAYASWGGGGDFNGRVSIVSDTRTGAWHYVTNVTTGRVIDTMRSRRTSLAENPQPSSVAITGA